MEQLLLERLQDRVPRNNFGSLAEFTVIAAHVIDNRTSDSTYRLGDIK
jgi:hypothetical protein